MSYLQKRLPCVNQAPVVQKVDSAIHWRNLYPLNNAIGFPISYPLDNDFSFWSTRGLGFMIVLRYIYFIIIF